MNTIPIYILNIASLKMTIKTKNFNPETDKKLICTCNDERCDKRSVKQGVLNMLQLVRDEYDLPMSVTSGGRCPYHKNELHRDKPADHQKGQGVDVRITGMVMAMLIIAIASKHGFNAFGINLKAGFIHLGFRPELVGKKPKVWTY